jgi:hypothetical protein
VSTSFSQFAWLLFLLLQSGALASEQKTEEETQHASYQGNPRLWRA